MSTELTTLSEDVFDQLLGDAPIPESSVNEESIIGGVKPVEDANAEAKEDNKKTEITRSVEEDLEILLGDEEDTAKESTKVDKKVVKEEESEDEIEEEDGEAEFLKAQAKGLIDRGLWFDFDEFDEVEWSQETYGNLLERQAQWKAEEKYNEMVEAAGPYGQAIFDHVKKGGNPEDIVSLFQEMKDVNELDKNTESGKIALLRKYYVDELGWSDTKFKRESDSWIDREVLDEEVTEVDGKLQEKILQKVESKRMEAEKALAAQEEAKTNFANNMNTIISAREDIPQKDKNEILSSLLDYKYKLKDGRIVNQFTIDFMNLQADPSKYVDLVLFVKNPEKYIEKVTKKVESETSKKNWNLIKNGSALGKKTGTGTNKRDSKPAQKGTVIDYKNLLGS